MKPALQPPAYCAGCYQQKPEKRHVDFEAAFDGPNILRPEVGPGIKIALDDLILCEDCIHNAAAMVGWIDGDKLKQENEELGVALEEANENVYNMRSTIDDLREANRKLMDNKFGKPKRVSVKRKAAA